MTDRLHPEETRRIPQFGNDRYVVPALENTCVVCGEPLDAYLDCLESESGKHISQAEDAKYRASLLRVSQ